MCVDISFFFSTLHNGRTERDREKMGCCPHFGCKYSSENDSNDPPGCYIFNRLMYEMPLKLKTILEVLSVICFITSVAYGLSFRIEESQPASVRIQIGSSDYIHFEYSTDETLTKWNECSMSSVKDANLSLMQNGAVRRRWVYLPQGYCIFHDSQAPLDVRYIRLVLGWSATIAGCVGIMCVIVFHFLPSRRAKTLSRIHHPPDEQTDIP